MSMYPGTLLPHKQTVEETRRGLLDLLAKINAEADKVLALQGLVTQALTATSSPTFAGLTVNGNIAVTGTVDGQDLSTRLDQNVKTTDSPTFLTVYYKSGAKIFDITPVADGLYFGETGINARMVIKTGGNVLIGKNTDLGGSAKLQVAGYTSLGGDTAHPAVKVKVLTGTTASTQGSTVSIAHGLDSTKIVYVDGIVTYTTGGGVPPNYYIDDPGYQFTFYFDATYINIRNILASSANILSKPVTITITYTE